ncbi:MAG: DUF2461 domain-containing protein [Paludibacteraceae bacterium]|nr:DUF2461 domain-containing protein [Paludibacteraceae bacterium]
MNTELIFPFLQELSENNNREWFHQNKPRYEQMMQEIELFVNQWLEQISTLEPYATTLTPKDCIWRIYRDIRFSPDKRPYKHWVGCWIAKNGGKKSPYGGYYVHFQPNACMFAAGIWGPEPNLLKALRQSVYDNYEEVEDIFAEPAFHKLFKDFDTEWMLKRVPNGYPQDWLHSDWLKHKNYTISCPITEKQVANKNFVSHVIDLCQTAKPINEFLNYTVDEMYGNL